LVFGIYGSRKREEEDTVTLESGCFVKEGTWAQIERGGTGGRKKINSEPRGNTFKRRRSRYGFRIWYD